MKIILLFFAFCWNNIQIDAAKIRSTIPLAPPIVHSLPNNKLSKSDFLDYQGDEPHSEPHPDDNRQSLPHPPSGDGKAAFDHQVPNEPVNQYVNSWGGPFMPQNGPPNGYPWNFMSPYGFAPVQTEYGILIPDHPSSRDPSSEPQTAFLVPIQNGPAIHEPHSSSESSPNDLIFALAEILPRSLLIFVAKWSSFIVSLLSLVAVGGFLTTGICTVTPLCSITFAGFTLPKLLRLFSQAPVTDERLNEAQANLNAAIQKFDEKTTTIEDSETTS